MFSINAMVGVSGAKKVNSGTINTEYQPCGADDGSGSSRRGRRAVGAAASLAPPAVNMSLGIALNADKGQLINGTSVDPYGMIYHVFNLSQPGNLSIIIQVFILLITRYDRG